MAAGCLGLAACIAFVALNDGIRMLSIMGSAMIQAVAVGFTLQCMAERAALRPQQSALSKLELALHAAASAVPELLGLPQITCCALSALHATLFVVRLYWWRSREMARIQASLQKAGPALAA